MKLKHIMDPAWPAVKVFVSSLVLVTVFIAVLPANAQFFTSVNGRCNPRSFYNYGTCRPGACPSTETYLPGNSYCDVYGNARRTQMVRCVSNLPCCVWGGQCRQTCLGGERQLNFRSDCGTAGRGVCCVDTRQTRVALPPAGPQPPPLPSPQVNIAQRQGTCRANPVTTTRVLGGSRVAPRDWPWMTRLVFRGGQRAVCSGVLVDDDTVLTVAHCVEGMQPRDVQVQVGNFDLDRRERDEALIRVTNIFNHRDFVRGSLGNDFAVLKLGRRLRLSQRVMPACLPDPRVSLVTGDRARCFVAGWGTDDQGRVSPVLRAAPVTVLDMGACQATLNAVSGSFSQLPPDVICTVGANNRQGGACLFDDGGMLACADVSGRYTLTGLVSQYSCGNLPTIYTRVDTYILSILPRL